MLNQNVKTYVIKSGIFFGVLAVLFGILLSLTLLNRNSWKKGLMLQTQKVLTKEMGDSVQLDGYCKLNSTFDSTCAVYNIKDSQDKAVIVRMQTIAGPVPGVFIHHSDGDTTFVGYCVDSGIAGSVYDKESFVFGINYWEEKISRLFAE